MKVAISAIKILFISTAMALLFSACGTGKPCDCPSFGQSQIDVSEDV